MIEPWKLTADLSRIIERFAASLEPSAFQRSGGLLVHNGATIEPGAIIKPRSPGTVLTPRAVVPRLGLIDQGAA
jgi:hypothetical protein